MLPRLVTGLVVVVLVGAALMLPTFFFALLSVLLCMLLVIEWVRLCHANNRIKYLFSMALPVLLFVSLLVPGFRVAIVAPVLVVVVLMWQTIVLLLLTRPMAIGRSLWGRFGPEIGMIILSGFWLGLIELHSNHFWLLVTVLTSVACFDIFALVWGSQFGKSKLAPRLSPAKSWEGVVGGTIAAITPIALLALAYAKGWVPAQPWYIPVAALSVVYAPFGDLFESLLKRLRGVKDSGQLLPGHGGVLDRIDSHLATVPCCACAAIVLSWYW